METTLIDVMLKFELKIKRGKCKIQVIKLKMKSKIY